MPAKTSCCPFFSEYSCTKISWLPMILTSLQKLKLIYVLIALICAEDSCAVIQVGLLSHFYFLFVQNRRVLTIYFLQQLYLVISCFLWSSSILSHWCDQFNFYQLENRAEYTFGFAEKRISFEEFFNHKFLATTRSTLYSGSSVDPYDIVAPSTLLLLKEKWCRFSLAMPAAHICSYPYVFFFHENGGDLHIFILWRWK